MSKPIKKGSLVKFDALVDGLLQQGKGAIKQYIGGAGVIFPAGYIIDTGSGVISWPPDGASAWSIEKEEP